jgi:GT2 family glycosyltransferase
MPAPGDRLLRLSVVIPTYRREQVLLDTVRYLHQQQPPPAEILLVDQSEQHLPATLDALQAWDRDGTVRWIRLTRPSITHAMNTGLEHARGQIVVFLDDDVIPGEGLLAAHALAHTEASCNIVAGQVLQPGEEVLPDASDGAEFRFRSGKRRWIDELMGGNFSVKRRVALALGGFDENFVHVAYRFEAEFCDRALSAGERILFEPRASIHHLRAERGGTRAYGNHLTTVLPSHAVGAYYYLLRARRVPNRLGAIFLRMLRSVRTRHHLLHSWWIPGTLFAELWGLLWALRLLAGGPRLIGSSARVRQSHD